MNPLASFELDYNSGLPVWIQVKNRIAYLIGSGEYKAGDQLPTVRSLAVDLDISYNTVNRAYMDLEREGTSPRARGGARSWPSATPWARPRRRQPRRAVGGRSDPHLRQRRHGRMTTSWPWSKPGWPRKA